MTIEFGGERSKVKKGVASQNATQVLLAAVCLVGFLGVSVYVALRPKATGLEVGLVNFLGVAIGIAVSFAQGRQSARDSAKGLVSASGQAAIRRLLSLAAQIEATRSLVTHGHGLLLRADETGDAGALLITQAQNATVQALDSQLRIVSDALEDWRDVIPETLEAVEGGKSVASA